MPDKKKSSADDTGAIGSGSFQLEEEFSFLEEEEDDFTIDPPKLKKLSPDQVKKGKEALEKISERRRNKMSKSDEPKRDKYGQPIYQGTIDTSDLSENEKKALDAIIFQGTQDDGEIKLEHSILNGFKPEQKTRVLPQNDPKSDHLLIKSITLSKNMKTGSWLISDVDTNKGGFEMGPEQNAKINQRTITNLALYLREIFEPDLKSYLGEEEEEES